MSHLPLLLPAEISRVEALMDLRIAFLTKALAETKSTNVYWRGNADNIGIGYVRAIVVGWLESLAISSVDRARMLTELIRDLKTHLTTEGGG